MQLSRLSSALLLASGTRVKRADALLPVEMPTTQGTSVLDPAAGVYRPHGRWASDALAANPPAALPTMGQEDPQAAGQQRIRDAQALLTPSTPAAPPAASSDPLMSSVGTLQQPVGLGTAPAGGTAAAIAQAQTGIPPANNLTAAPPAQPAPPPAAKPPGDSTLSAEIAALKQRQSSGVFTAAPATNAMAARGNDGTQAVPVGTQPPPQAPAAPSRANVAGNPYITGGQLGINGSPSWANPTPPKPQAPAAPTQPAPPPALGSNPGGVNNAQINNTWQNLQPTHTREVKGGVLQPPKPIGGSGGGWGTTGGLQPSSPTGKGKPVVGSGARPNIFGPR